MAYPTLVSPIAATPFTSFASPNHNFTNPETSDGDLLVYVTTNLFGATVATPSGLSLLGTPLNQADWLRQYAFVRECDGTESEATVNFVTSDDTTLLVGLAHFAAGTWTAYARSTGVTGEPAPGVGIDVDEVTASVSGTHRFMAVGSCTTHSANSTSPPNYTQEIEAALGSLGNDNHEVAMDWSSRELEALSDDPGVIIFDDDDHTAAFAIVVEGTGFTAEQEGFRFRNDDGSETTATWRQDQDVDDTADQGETLRIRNIIDFTGNPPSGQAGLYFKESTEPDSEIRLV